MWQFGSGIMAVYGGADDVDRAAPPEHACSLLVAAQYILEASMSHMAAIFTTI